MNPLIAIAPLIFLAAHPVLAETGGYLVFEVGRYRYNVGSHQGDEIKQKFKVPLTKSFLSKFKNIPSQNSMGTGFFCNGGNLRSGDGGTRFMWWMRKTTDGRWSLNMWGMGDENLKGLRSQSRNPNVSQYVTVKTLDDIDMTYQISYLGKDDGLNISFRAKYVKDQDLESEGPVLAAPVKNADQSELFKGDDSSELPLTISCGFQDG